MGGIIGSGGEQFGNVEPNKDPVPGRLAPGKLTIRTGGQDKVIDVAPSDLPQKQLNKSGYVALKVRTSDGQITTTYAKVDSLAQFLKITPKDVKQKSEAGILEESLRETLKIVKYPKSQSEPLKAYVGVNQKTQSSPPSAKADSMQIKHPPPPPPRRVDSLPPEARTNQQSSSPGYSRLGENDRGAHTSSAPGYSHLSRKNSADSHEYTDLSDKAEEQEVVSRRSSSAASQFSEVEREMQELEDTLAASEIIVSPPSAAEQTAADLELELEKMAAEDLPAEDADLAAIHEPAAQGHEELLLEALNNAVAAAELQPLSSQLDNLEKPQIQSIARKLISQVVGQHANGIVNLALTFGRIFISKEDPSNVTVSSLIRKCRNIAEWQLFKNSKQAEAELYVDGKTRNELIRLAGLITDTKKMGNSTKELLEKYEELAKKEGVYKLCQVLAHLYTKDETAGTGIKQSKDPKRIVKIRNFKRALIKGGATPRLADLIVKGITGSLNARPTAEDLLQALNSSQKS